MQAQNPQSPLAQDPLGQLRDIHLPDPVSAWPPAPGWWILAALAVFLITTTIVYCYRRYQRNAYRRLALKTLTELKHNRDKHTDQHYLQHLNRLLKQTALAAQAGSTVAGLSGKPWLEFLDHSAQTKGFSQGIGLALLDGPYCPNPDSVDINQLHDLSGRWIKRHRISC
jgi:Domain of unknown function (DUF4381)